MRVPSAIQEKRGQQEVKLKRHEEILGKIFPGYDLLGLETKSRPELLDRLGIASLPIHCQPSQGQPPNPIPLPSKDASTHEEDDSAALSENENGDVAPEPQWDESLDQREAVATDDINAIGLATDKQARSYLGISSMSAAFRTIFKLYPPTKEYTAARARACAAAPPPSQLATPFLTRDPALSLLREQRCIDFYFDHFHAVTPLIDEDDFRKQYAMGVRRDSSWLGLLNMVFALGSIASGSDSLHQEYYKAARASFSLDSLGSGNIYSLQALCLLGGFYLHYRNSPNMAYGILGAAHRVAVALGLHREPRPGTGTNEARRAETHRRTWWSLVCLDSWACMTQGRPTLGRWDPATMDTALPAPLHDDDHAAASLRASALLCRVCDRVQDRLARVGPRIAHDEILALDVELLDWHETALPPVLRDDDAASARNHPRLRIAREFICTRYLNARVVLARCALLLTAHDRRRRPIVVEEDRTLARCCAVAADAIDAVALRWTPNRFLVWSAAWYLFQASTVPLLAMAMERSGGGGPSSPAVVTATPPRFVEWRESLAKALGAFAEMRAWMRPSDRSPDIVAAMYEALTADADVVVGRTPSVSDGSGLDLLGWCDEQLAEMDWSEFLGEDSMPPDMMPLA
ncbi:Transcription factor [Cordyceps fumosorosea ARSEF 2679]|uniref:Transcription factor n=1 Tax=Cordyceps fumosorosea (strain ARSEF 2679) TaxID=1081104 RepID=A0A162JUD0_CORFA|nr:Transcription factor [Cordyceps fumosorosea ARSEF 2679]OAA73922.1 Transcription factor [Cordyceps fumosorosea ARSEF 2679]